MGKRNFKVSGWQINRWLSLYGYIPSCIICGHGFGVGDLVVSKYKRHGKETKHRRNPKTRHYCDECINGGSTPIKLSWFTTKGNN